MQIMKDRRNVPRNKDVVLISTTSYISVGCIYFGIVAERRVR